MGLGALSPVGGRGEAARRTYSMAEFMEAKEAAATVEALVRARELVDAAHAADPSRTPDGRPAELVYADRMEEWITRLVPDASPLLRLAARCQHLERWTVPREDFPVGRAGYNAWRRTLYRKQADRAKELLLQAGVPEAEADEVATWVSKTGLRRVAGTQALEDAACMVFLEHEIEGFARKHEDYSAEKMVTILQRIWRKMSAEAREAARRLEMPPAFAELLQQAAEAEEARTGAAEDA
jgi:hypothetical protein